MKSQSRTDKVRMARQIAFSFYVPVGRLLLYFVTKTMAVALQGDRGLLTLCRQRPQNSASANWWLLLAIASVVRFEVDGCWLSSASAGG